MPFCKEGSDTMVNPREHKSLSSGPTCAYANTTRSPHSSFESLTFIPLSHSSLTARVWCTSLLISGETGNFVKNSESFFVDFEFSVAPGPSDRTAFSST